MYLKQPYTKYREEEVFSMGESKTSGGSAPNGDKKRCNKKSGAA
jgi:hypothetical protein